MNSNNWLHSWQDIANYFHVSKRTISRWNLLCPMPVKYSPTGSVMVKAEDLDNWLAKFNRIKRSILKRR